VYPSSNGVIPSRCAPFSNNDASGFSASEGFSPKRNPRILFWLQFELSKRDGLSAYPNNGFSLGISVMGFPCIAIARHIY
jgi:hypothetical protein